MNYSQMNYAKLHQMESWPAEELLFSITQFQMQDSLFGTKIFRLLPASLSKTLLAQQVWITAKHLSHLCHSVNLIMLKWTPTVFTTHNCCEVEGGVRPCWPSSYKHILWAFYSGLNGFGLFSFKLNRYWKNMMAIDKVLVQYCVTSSSITETVGLSSHQAEWCGWQMSRTGRHPEKSGQAEEPGPWECC